MNYVNYVKRKKKKKTHKIFEKENLINIVKRYHLIKKELSE